METIEGEKEDTKKARLKKIGKKGKVEIK